MLWKKPRRLSPLQGNIAYPKTLVANFCSMHFDNYTIPRTNIYFYNILCFVIAPHSVEQAAYHCLTYKLNSICVLSSQRNQDILNTWELSI